MQPTVDIETPHRILALGIALDDLGQAEALAYCAKRAPTLPFGYVSTPNATMQVQVDRGVRDTMRALDGAELVLNDSRVLQTLLRVMFGRRIPLATGSDLSAALFQQVIGPEDPICVIGGDQALADSLRARFGLRRLVQVIPSYGFIHDPAEIARCIAFVQAHPSRFVFIACGAPQSEILAANIVAAGRSVGLGLCIGASLEFITGQKQRAPMIWQRLGMEWLFRVLQEPKRLGRRLFTLQLPLLLVVLRYRLLGRPGTPGPSGRSISRTGMTLDQMR